MFGNREVFLCWLAGMCMLIPAHGIGYATQSYFGTPDCSSALVASLAYATPTTCSQEGANSWWYDTCKGSTVVSHTCTSPSCSSSTCSDDPIPTSCDTLEAQFGYQQMCFDGVKPFPNSFTYQEIENTRNCSTPDIALSISYILGICLPNPNDPSSFFQYQYNDVLKSVQYYQCSDSLCSVCQCNRQSIGCTPTTTNASYKFFVTSPASSVNTPCVSSAEDEVARSARRLAASYRAAAVRTAA